MSTAASHKNKLLISIIQFRVKLVHIMRDSYALTSNDYDSCISFIQDMVMEKVFDYTTEFTVLHAIASLKQCNDLNVSDYLKKVEILLSTLEDKGE